MPGLQIGAPALDFMVPDIEGRQIRLSDYRGKKVLLTFFRFATCPFCTIRFSSLLREAQQYAEQGVQIIAVFESSAEYIQAYMGQRGLSFPVIADPEAKLYQLYGVQKSIPGLLLGMLRLPTLMRALFDPIFHMAKPDASIIRLPADFLIGSDQLIHAAYYGRDIGDHIPFSSIDRFAAQITLPVSEPHSV